MRSGAEAEDTHHLLAFVRCEIELLQAELSVTIPFIPQENEED